MCRHVIDCAKIRLIRILSEFTLVIEVFSNQTGRSLDDLHFKLHRMIGHARPIAINRCKIFMVKRCSLSAWRVLSPVGMMKHLCCQSTLNTELVKNNHVNLNNIVIKSRGRPSSLSRVLMYSECHIPVDPTRSQYRVHRNAKIPTSGP